MVAYVRTSIFHSRVYISNEEIGNIEQKGAGFCSFRKPIGKTLALIDLAAPVKVNQKIHYAHPKSFQKLADRARRLSESTAEPGLDETITHLQRMYIEGAKPSYANVQVQKDLDECFHRDIFNLSKLSYKRA